MNKIIKEIENRGYSIIKNFLNKKEVNNYKKLIFKHENKNRRLYKGTPARDTTDKIIYNLQNKDYKFIKLISNKIIINIAKYFLNDPFYGFLPNSKPNYILNFFNARSSGSKLDLHIDCHIPFKGKNIFMMQFVFLLEKSTKKNGCTVVVNNSHKSGKFSNRSEKKLTFLEGEPGDLIIWDSRLWHGTTANKEKKSRWAIVTTFSSWFIKQKMDMPKSIPKKIYKKCNNIEKQLLGFSSIPPKNENERINTKRGYIFPKLLGK